MIGSTVMPMLSDGLQMGEYCQVVEQCNHNSGQLDFPQYTSLRPAQFDRIDRLNSIEETSSS